MTPSLQKRLIGGGIVLFVLIILIKVVSNFYSIPFYTYPGFGIKIPAGYSTLGIDVSHHQDKINWKQVSEMKDLGMKCQFVFMKATQGNYMVDKQFKRNWSKAKEYQLSRGAYLFFDPRKGGKSQAKLFIKNVNLKTGDFPPVIDFEDLYGVSKSKAQQGVLECAKVLEQHYKVKPILYTYVDFYRNNSIEEFDSFPLWVAHYKSFGKPRIDRDWHFWQFSDRGNFDGIGSKVDFNVFKGRKTTMNKLLIQ